MRVKPKKHLGQHFLKDLSIAKQTADALEVEGNDFLLEIGSGTGVLTQFLFDKTENLFLIEIDDESIDFLRVAYPDFHNNIIHADFLKLDIKSMFNGNISIIGNFPYNISSQILFKVLENRTVVEKLVGMFQKEVAERISADYGNKKYGILSVLIQTFYDVELLFEISADKFLPPPKVDSAVIRLCRREREEPKFDDKFFIKVVKTAFNQRRKMLRNTLKVFFPNGIPEHEFMTLRPEQLSPAQFEELTLFIDKNKQ